MKLFKVTCNLKRNEEDVYYSIVVAKDEKEAEKLAGETTWGYDINVTEVEEIDTSHAELICLVDEDFMAV